MNFIQRACEVLPISYIADTECPGVVASISALYSRCPRFESQHRG